MQAMQTTVQPGSRASKPACRLCARPKPRTAAPASTGTAAATRNAAPAAQAASAEPDLLDRVAASLLDDPTRPPLRECVHGCQEHAFSVEGWTADQRHSLTCPHVQSYIGSQLYTPLESCGFTGAAKKAFLADLFEKLAAAPAASHVLFSAHFVRDMIDARHYRHKLGMFQPLSEADQAKLQSSIAGSLLMHERVDTVFEQLDAQLFEDARLAPPDPVAQPGQWRETRMIEDNQLLIGEMLREACFEWMPTLVYLLPRQRPPASLERACTWGGCSHHLGRCKRRKSTTQRRVPCRLPHGNKEAIAAAEAAAAAGAAAAALRGDAADPLAIARAAIAAVVQHTEAQFALPPGHALSMRYSLDETQAYLQRYQEAFRSLPGHSRKSAGAPTAAADTQPLGRVPTLLIGGATQALRNGAKSFNQVPVLTLCGIARVVYDMLHSHLHMVNNVMFLFMCLLNMFFTLEGALKSEAEIMNYLPPNGSSRSESRAWRERGFYLFDVFARMSELHPDLKGKSYAKARPMRGWEAGNCCDLIADYGVWVPAVFAACPGLHDLKDCEYSQEAVSDRAREMISLLDVLFPMLFVVLKMARSTRASAFLDVVPQYIACLRRTLMALDEIVHYSVRTYDHSLFCHFIDQVRKFGSLIKYSCWVTEHMNIAWEFFLSHRTSRGGGRAQADGSKDHLNANRQAFHRMVVVYSGLMQRFFAKLGVPIKWHHN